MSFGLVAATVVGGVISANASKKAAKTQAGAAEQAADAQLEASREANATQRAIADQQVGLARDQFEYAKQIQQPGMQAGNAARGRLLQLLGLDAPELSSNTGDSAAIRARLAPKFQQVLDTTAAGEQSIYEDTKGLDAAVNRELAGLSSTGAMQPRGSDFGSLTRRFNMADFEADPGYQFRLEQGQNALDRAAAASGRFNSGRAAKDLMRFNQGEASQEYGRSYDRFNADNDRLFNRFSSVAGNGQVASNNLSAAGQAFSNQAGGALGQYGQSAGQNIMAGGNARASAYTGAGNATAAGQVGVANAFNSALGQGANFYQQNQLLQMLKKSGADDWRTTGNGFDR